VSGSRATICHSCPSRVTAIWGSLGLLALVWSTACRSGVPVIDAGTKPPAARAAIAGTVRGPEGITPIAGRTVEAINVATGETRSATTGTNGGFTIEAPAGQYRLELPLKDGETIVRHPGIVDLDRGDVDSQLEFVIVSVRLTRPHGPTYRLDNGLGSPIA
jgi:hypothetical protein